MDANALQRLADQLEIRELVARYNYAIDEGRPEEWVATFVPDGTFESTLLGKHTGPEALHAFVIGYIAAVQRAALHERLHGRDRRRRRRGSRCYLIAVNNAAAPIISATAVYDDILRRTPGWLAVRAPQGRRGHRHPLITAGAGHPTARPNGTGE